MVWCGVVWCGVVWCGVVWCAVRCGAVQCGAVVYLLRVKVSVHLETNLKHTKQIEQDSRMDNHT